MTRVVKLKSTGEHVEACALVLAALPALSVVLFLSLVWRVEQAYGARPTYGNPDPKDTPFWLHLNLCDLILATSLVGSFAAVGYGVYVYRISRLKSLLLLPVVAVYVAYIWFLFADPAEI